MDAKLQKELDAMNMSLEDILRRCIFFNGRKMRACMFLNGKNMYRCIFLNKKWCTPIAFLCYPVLRREMLC